MLTALRGSYDAALVQALGSIGLALVAPIITRPTSLIVTSRVGKLLLYVIAALSTLSVIGNVVLLLQGG